MMIFLFHIPKTGGSTLFWLLSKQFQAREVYNAGPFEMRSFRAENLTGKRLGRAHCDFAALDYKAGISDTIVILREPVARVWSLWRHASRSSPHLLYGIAQNGFEAFVTHDQVRNEMTRRLAGHYYMGFSAADRRLLPVARKHLKSMSVVGFTEDFGGLLLKINQRFGYLLSDPGMSRNNYDLPTDTQKQFIRDVNELDIELYNHARSIYV